ncbi:unnamed protein product, partial [Brassica napus]
MLKIPPLHLPITEDPISGSETVTVHFPQNENLIILPSKGTSPLTTNSASASFSLPPNPSQRQILPLKPLPKPNLNQLQFLPTTPPNPLSLNQTLPSPLKPM